MSDGSASGGNVRPVCVDHMTFPVGDLERSLAFYRAALVKGMGWSEIDEEGAPADAVTTGRWGAQPEGSRWGATWPPTTREAGSSGRTDRCTRCS